MVRFALTEENKRYLCLIVCRENGEKDFFENMKVIHNTINEKCTILVGEYKYH